MDWLKEKIGELWDSVVGDRKTVEFTGKVSDRVLTVSSSPTNRNMQIGVRITQIVYQTTYKRWWLRTTQHSVYHVLAFASDDIKTQLDQRFPQLFVPQVYPLLCNSLLRRSKIPHMYALHAFLDQMGPFYPTLKLEL